MINRAVRPMTADEEACGRAGAAIAAWHRAWRGRRPAALREHTIELELAGHPDVLEASVIGVPDEKWQERPLACVVRREGSEVSFYVVGRRGSSTLGFRGETVEDSFIGFTDRPSCFGSLSEVPPTKE